MITENEKKVVHFSEWKEKRSMQTYFSVLSFNQLITESRGLVEELKAGPITPFMIQKASLVLKEIKNRVHSHSPEMSSALHNLSLQINSKL